MIYTKVKALAEKEGITIAALERKVGLANGTIGRWDTFSPNVKSLQKVSRYFGVSLDNLAPKEGEDGDAKTYSNQS